MVRLCAFLLVLSGAASLIYQVTWVRLLGLSMGATSASVSTVVSAFFAGLALGGFLARKLRQRDTNQLGIYLRLEGVIGLSGLVSLAVLSNLDRVVTSMPLLGSGLLLKFAVSFVVLSVPTVCMGATFPIMARVLVREGKHVGRRLGELYAFNTLGAVAGALLAGFVLVPSLGLDGAIVVAALLNASVVGLGSLFAGRFGSTQKPSAAVEVSAANMHERPLGALLAVAATGFVSIAAEIGWTKYLVMFVGSTLYGFSAVLAVYLTGVALGSWFARGRVDRLRTPETWLFAGLGLLSVMLLLTRNGFSWLPSVQASLLRDEVAVALGQSIRYATVFVLLFPSTFLLGALFPLTLKIYCRTREGAETRVGEAYSLNTLAGIIGALVAGFWWIPALGTHHMLTSTALLPLGVSPSLLGKAKRSRARWGALSFALVSAGLVIWSRPLNLQSLVEYVRLDRNVTSEQKVLFSKEGRTGLVSVASFGNNRANLYNDGLNEATIRLDDPYGGTLVEAMLGLLPYLLHERPERAFVIGLGGGTTMRALSYAGLRQVRVAELEPVVAEALSTVVGSRAAGLEDDKVRLDFDDARHLLLLEDDRYDIIASQPSHPWRAGAGNLFTEEFFRLSQERLKPGGIHAQWLNLFRMDVTTLKAILRSFGAAFPHVASFAWRKNLLLLGSRDPLVFRPQKIRERMEREPVKRMFKSVGFLWPHQVLAMFALSRRDILEAVGDGPRSTDTNLLPEVRLARLAEDATGDEAPIPFLRSHATFDVLGYLPRESRAAFIYRTAWLLNKKDRYLITTRDVVARLASIDEERSRELSRELARRGR